MNSFSGKIIKGKGIGRELGFPTANIEINKNDLGLGAGVYAARAEILSKEYGAALTVMENPFIVEVYLINFPNSDIYGDTLEVSPIEKVSEIEKCDSQEELKEKIIADLKKIKKIL